MESDRGTGLLFLPVAALVLLAAHFVHAGLWPVAAVCLGCTGLVRVRRPWAARVLQSLLVIGAIEWILTAVGLAHMRAAHGQAYGRMLAILGVVTAFTLLAAFVFQTASLQRRFGLDRNTDLPSPPSG
jgi:hypothetical protein